MPTAAHFSDPFVDACALLTIAGPLNIWTCAYFPNSLIFRSAYYFRAYILAGPLLIVGAHIFPLFYLFFRILVAGPLIIVGLLYIFPRVHSFRIANSYWPLSSSLR